AATLAALGLCAGCSEKPKALEELRGRGVLRVVTINSQTSYYLGAHGPEGIEFQLARAFAESLDINLVNTPVADARAMQAEMAAGKADLAAARITATDAWLQVGEATQPYEQIPQLVVCRRGQKRPRSTLQIEIARLAVCAGSPQERVLERIKRTVA